MNVFGFGDELHGVVAHHFSARQDLFEHREIVAVDDEQLVLVELHLDRNCWVEHGNARAAIVEQ